MTPSAHDTPDRTAVRAPDRTASLGVAEARLPRAGVLDTVRVSAQVVLPLVARGVIKRRPRVVRLLERADADRRAVQLLQRLRRRYGSGPLLLPVPTRPMAVLLSPDHVHRVLEQSPEPFRVASDEKRSALAHFQPSGLLATQDPAARAERRRFNETVLDTDSPVHAVAGLLVPKVHEEMSQLVDDARDRGELDYDAFATAFWRMIRRVVLGDAARDDTALTELLDDLREDANWAFAKPKREAVRRRFLARVDAYVQAAEPGSLAAVVAATPAGPQTPREQQLPQWLFAFDAAAIATYRALALLAAHPVEQSRVHADLIGLDRTTPQPLTHLRGCVLESLRLWPTTPAILRDTTAPTAWGAATMPAGTGLVVYAPFFHRDDENLAYAHAFTPDLWAQDRTAHDWPLVPFSGGPGMCPGRNVVLLTTSHALATLLGAATYSAPADRLSADRPLPGTLDPFSLRLSLR